MVFAGRMPHFHTTVAGMGLAWMGPVEIDFSEGCSDSGVKDSNHDQNAASGKGDRATADLDSQSEKSGAVGCIEPVTEEVDKQSYYQRGGNRGC